MNKADLIDSIAKEADLTKVKAKDALDAFTDAVIGALKKGERVTIVGFGTFLVTDRAARNGRNPQNPNVLLKIKARKVPKFKVGKEFSEKIGGKR